MPSTGLDAVDVRILALLQDDARRTNVELAQAVGLSPSPCLRRVRELERRGVIRRYATLVDPHVVGLPVSVFVNVTLDKQVEEALEVFERAVRERPEVMECYLMTGEADYLLRVVSEDLAAYQRFLMDHLTRIPGVANIKSSFALKQVQYRTAMPLTHLAAPTAPAGRAPARSRVPRDRRAGQSPRDHSGRRRTRPASAASSAPRIRGRSSGRVPPSGR